MNKNKPLTIRTATPNDAKALSDIYAPYVTNTAITFEYDVPSLDEFKSRIENTLKKYPYLVALSGDEIVGYSYAAPFKERAAYDWSVETTVYVKSGNQGLGIGKALYSSLESALRLLNITNVNACIAYPVNGVDDEYLTANSVEFHAHLGYKKVGEFQKCAYKFDRWYNMIWMEKFILPHSNNPPTVIPYSSLEK